MTDKIAVDLGNVQKTLFLPLWGRATESKKAQPLLVDQTAVRIMAQVNYDFSSMAKRLSPVTQAAWIMRSLHTDRVVRAFLAKYPQGTIVNLGCGLDTTFERVDNGHLRWYDLDLPDVIGLRRNLIQETSRRRFIASSFLEEGWLKDIVVESQALFIAAGVFYYFTEAEIRGFLGRLADRFPGSEVVFDVASPVGVRTANQVVIRNGGLDEKSYLTWALASPSVITAWDRRFRIVALLYYFGEQATAFPLTTRLVGKFSDLLRIQYMIHLENQRVPVQKPPEQAQTAADRAENPSLAHV
jgi:O-methyltransferase involved in polyketide biosynthesis